MENKVLLDVHGLNTEFRTDDGTLSVLQDVGFYINEGETLGIVGESGSGKSVTALSVMHLLPERTGKVTDGEVLFEGKDLLKISSGQMRNIRGNDIAMIFQEPMTSLDPVYTIGYQISESMIRHQKLSKREALDKALELLKAVGIPSPEKRINEYPHQLSGGMRQRVMIAIALACDPKLLIADEPTTALDVTIQAQILELLRKLKKERGMAIWLITHDLGVIAEMCDRVVVMYGGHIVEAADVHTIFKQPAHPYTKGLLKSIPRMDEEVETLNVIRGNVPNLLNRPSGCCFHPRCDYAEAICKERCPQLTPVGEEHLAACFLKQPLKAEG